MSEHKPNRCVEVLVQLQVSILRWTETEFLNLVNELQEYTRRVSEGSLNAYELAKQGVCVNQLSSQIARDAEEHLGAVVDLEWSDVDAEYVGLLQLLRIRLERIADHIPRGQRLLDRAREAFFEANELFAGLESYQRFDERISLFIKELQDARDATRDLHPTIRQQMIESLQTGGVFQEVRFHRKILFRHDFPFDDLVDQPFLEFSRLLRRYLRRE